MLKLSHYESFQTFTFTESLIFLPSHRGQWSPSSAHLQVTQEVCRNADSRYLVRYLFYLNIVYGSVQLRLELGGISKFWIVSVALYHQSQCRDLLLSFLNVRLHLIYLFLQLSLLPKQRILLGVFVELGFGFLPAQSSHLHFDTVRHFIEGEIFRRLLPSLELLYDGLGLLLVVDTLHDIPHVVPALGNDGSHLQFGVDGFLQDRFQEFNPLHLDVLQLVQDKAELPVVVVLLVPVCLDQLLGVQTSVIFILSYSRLTEDKDFISQVST